MRAGPQNRLVLTDMPDAQPVITTAVKGVTGIVIFLLVGFIVIIFEANTVWMVVLGARGNRDRARRRGRDWSQA